MAADSGNLSPRPALRPASAGGGEARFAVPAWLMSVVLHVVLILVAGATLRFSPSGASAEPTRTVGVVLKHTTEQAEYYERAEDATANTQADRTARQEVDFLDVAPSVDPSDMLPQPTDWIGPGAADGGVPSAEAMTDGGQQGALDLGGGQTRTSVFGLSGEGFKFVYVFDRSGSMGGAGRSALNAAKAELMASLESLDDNHQFQIIFYNHQPLVFNLAGPAGRLVWGNERNKLQAHRFIQGVTADGGTQHTDPLHMALGMRPDVIFFLTDADEPSLNSRELAAIARANGGRTVIHAIEFGFGPSLGQENFLMRLAHQNGGEHRYVDITTFGSSR